MNMFHQVPSPTSLSIITLIKLAASSKRQASGKGYAIYILLFFLFFKGNSQGCKSSLILLYGSGSAETKSPTFLFLFFFL
jgi:hypothetical protein